MYHTIAPLVAASKIALLPIARRQLYAQVAKEEKIEEGDKLRGWQLVMFKYISFRAINNYMFNKKIFHDGEHILSVIAKTAMIGVLQVITVEPIDAIITRNLLQDTPGIGQTFKDLIRSKVSIVRALYAGIVPALLQVLTYRLFHYGVSVAFYTLGQKYGVGRFPLLVAQSLICTLVSYPFETLRVRAEKEFMVKKKKYRSIGDHFREAWGGFRSLYAGVGYSFIPQILTYAMTRLHPYILNKTADQFTK
eukprot:TRINITY_DN7893_c0_g2_i1.p1 TRINITY_DN7893_c0_g2~~TRINITY_DN7893_c0_g2_i1.p1  ORF type:complete len:266 (+),score=20.31 TRINITY_DN7893_c0_g2_i1:49-798(+)